MRMELHAGEHAHAIGNVSVARANLRRFHWPDLVSLPEATSHQDTSESLWCHHETASHARRAAAIQAGAVPALCNILVQGETGAPPVALGDVLKALYAIIATDAGSGAGTSELFASGGIHSLVGCPALVGDSVV